MIKVLKKAFEILEYIASRGGGPVLPGEIAPALKMNHPTCIRILRDMLEAGYLVQVSRQRGYSLGPMCYGITKGKKYMQDMLDKAEPLVKKCSEKLGQSVILAIRHKELRYVICHHNHNPKLHINMLDPSRDDLYLTGTGRILLAFADKCDLEYVIEKKGLPDIKKWKEASNMKKMLETLKKIREAGFVQVKTTSPYMATAFPVYVNGVFTCALGASIPRENPPAGYFEELSACAETISHNCSHMMPIE